MPRYIDAEKLCELARNHINKSVDCNDIMRFPIEDVVGVRHGHWILVDIEKGTGVCSNCNRQDHVDGLAVYCRFCGARMDEEEA